MLWDTAQRPWSLPSGPWMMKQRWHEVLFAHWYFPPDALRRLVPPQLQFDTFDGKAWIGLVAFRMSGIRLRGLPPVPWLSRFPELNLRTYVKVGDRAGVYFLSLDGDSRLGVALARRWFHVPYYRAVISLYRQGDTVHYTSRRRHRRAPEARFSCSYAPLGESGWVEPGTFEHWLVERYCLFAVDPRGRIVSGEIHHSPWEIQAARVQVRENTMGAAVGLELGQPEHVVFSRMQEAVFWLPRPVKSQSAAAGGRDETDQRH